MKIALISLHPFPFGMASTNRINALCRGLIEAGDEPTVIMPFPPEPHNSAVTLPDSGIWKGIKYVHLSGRKRNKNKFLRAIALKSGLRYKIGVLRTKKWLLKHPQDAVIIYDDECDALNDFGKAIKASGAKAIFIFDEYPTPIREQGALQLPQSKRLRFSQILPLFDGYISINKVLAKFYNDIVSKPTLELSMIVDTDRFSTEPPLRKEWLTYMGQILWDKDNILNIIDAFNRIKDDFPNITFHIFGKGDAESIQLIQDRIHKYGLEGRVVLEGFAPDDKVTEIMMSSKILVSSQPDNKRVEGVLSTKLAEYVASGTPTVMCDVGANKTYLSDDDCFFVTPDNPIEYANTLRSILYDYQKALIKAENGVQTINRLYSTLNQGHNLSNYIHNL